MAQVVIKDEGADTQPRRLGGRLQSREGSPVAGVIGREEHVDACGLRAPPRLRDPIAASLASIQHQTESEGTLGGSCTA